MMMNKIATINFVSVTFYIPPCDGFNTFLSENEDRKKTLRKKTPFFTEKLHPVLKIFISHWHWSFYKCNETI